MANIQRMLNGVAVNIDEAVAFPAPTTPAEILAAATYKSAAEAKAAMVAWIDALTSKIMATYPQAVIQRWPIEEAAARAVVANNPTPAQLDLITTEGATKGRTPADHAAQIILKANLFKAIAKDVNTLRLTIDAQLDAATDPGQYEVILAAAKVQALQLAQPYGLAP